MPTQSAQAPNRHKSIFSDAQPVVTSIACSGSIQPNVVEVHLARTAGRRRIALGAQTVVASPMVSMPSVDGGVVWTGVDGVFQKWDDGSWVYVWQAAPEEPAPQSRWPDREMVEQHILSFAGRQWTGGYLEKAGGDQTEDRVMVAQDDGEPAEGYYPTRLWRGGDVIVDTRVLDPPDEWESDPRLVVGLYAWPTMERLGAVTSSGESLPDEFVLSIGDER